MKTFCIKLINNLLNDFSDAKEVIIKMKLQFCSISLEFSIPKLRFGVA